MRREKRYDRQNTKPLKHSLRDVSRVFVYQRVHRTQSSRSAYVEYLFDTLYNVYPLYDYFGGKEAFDEAENAILQQCEETESITAEEFQNVLLEQLSKKRCDAGS